jgi:hypothetical protein
MPAKLSTCEFGRELPRHEAVVHYAVVAVMD